MSAKQVVFTLFGFIVKIVIVVVVVVGVYKLATTVYDFGYRIFAEDAIDEEGQGVDVEVSITAGKSTMQVAEMLVEQGLIRDAKLFYVQELLSGEKGGIQPGVYILNTSMAPEEMIGILCAGPQDTTGEENSDY